MSEIKNYQGTWESIYNSGIPKKLKDLDSVELDMINELYRDDLYDIIEKLDKRVDALGRREL